MFTDINGEDRLVQATFADYLRDTFGWESTYAFNTETFGPAGTLGRSCERDVVLVRDLREALGRLNPTLPDDVREQALAKLTAIDPSRSLLQHNREFYGYIRDGVPVEWRDAGGELRQARARVLDFRTPSSNRFLAVRELKIQGVRVPHYNRRADLVCFVNGLPLVFIELKAVHKNIRLGFDGNLTDYMEEHTVPHAFHHNAFLVVSNGDRARYGSITSKWEHFAEWKRNDEQDPGALDAQVLLNGMLAKDRLLDLVENFILFDDSKPGGTRKIVAKNHQYLGVNNAVASVQRQEALKETIPPDQRLRYRVADVAADGHFYHGPARTDLRLVERAHPDLGRLGVFWHTQGSGKSYSMAFFVEKVRRVVPGNFTFLVMTDREDLDTQITRTFVGCGVADENAPRAASGDDLRHILAGNHRYVFSLVHKFNRTVHEPYSLRDDIIVLSDEAHRTQAGKLARNMRLALPNAAFIGFTGTPLFKYDNLTRRIFGGYVSRYDFKRSEEDQSTVRLVYENRGEKLGLARLDLNDRIAEKVEEADLNPDQVAHLEKLLGKDYEVITADDRLDKIAEDFVEHCATRFETGKSMLVCIDKITCARMFDRVLPRWQLKLERVRAEAAAVATQMTGPMDPDKWESLSKARDLLRRQADWMAGTIVEVIFSEAQNEVRDFRKWGFDVVPHRDRMKRGFETPDGKRVSVEDAFKDPTHPFRIAIVCAMWLTGFDVECLATLYIDKPMKAHSLMQAIARANRVYPGKDCGVIVDYNGMLKSLREALAQYALGDDETGDTPDVVLPVEQLVAALAEAIETTEAHLKGLGFDPAVLVGAKGFDRIQALRDATNALDASDEAKRRFQIMANQVFGRFKALLMEPSAYAFAERHDNIEAIFRKLEEKRDNADVTDLLKGLHRIVNEAIHAQGEGADRAEGLSVDLSRIDFQKLRNEFAGKVKRKYAAVQAIRDVIEQKLQQMLARSPQAMDYNRRYQDIIAAYNREKDRATVEDTFSKLMTLAESLDEEQRRAAAEGLTDDELALFDLLFMEDIPKTDRERLKQASRSLLSVLVDLLARMHNWTLNAATQAEVRVRILDSLWTTLPRPPYTEEQTQGIAERVYEYVWERSASGLAFAAPEEVDATAANLGSGS